MSFYISSRAATYTFTSSAVPLTLTLMRTPALKLSLTQISASSIFLSGLISPSCLYKTPLFSDLLSWQGVTWLLFYSHCSTPYIYYLPNQPFSFAVLDSFFISVSNTDLSYPSLESQCAIRCLFSMYM